MMPLYKLSHTDELILEQEKVSLEKDIARLTEILNDENKLNRVLIKDLKGIAEKYGDDRRTLIVEKGEGISYTKRDLIAKEEVMVAVSRDGYMKRSSIKSYKGSNESLPGLKAGDVLVAKGNAMTTDYLICFTNIGNYVCLPVYVLTENKWKEEGAHINQFVTISSGEKIIKAIIVKEFKKNVYIGFVSKYGQIKRTELSQFDTLRHSRPVKCMKLLSGDEVAAVEIFSGNSDVLVLTSGGNCSLFNENDITPVGLKAGGVKSIAQLKKQTVVTMLPFLDEERGKVVLITDKGCQRIFSIEKINKTARLGKVQTAFSCFKNDPHELIGAKKVPYRVESLLLNLYLSDESVHALEIKDFSLTEALNAKKNIKIPNKLLVRSIIDDEMEVIDKNTKVIVIEHPEIEDEEEPEVLDDVALTDNEITSEEPAELMDELQEEVVEAPKKQKKSDKKQDEDSSFEQISIFEGLDDE